MKAITFQGQKNVRTEVVPDPVLKGPKDAIIRVICTALCGSDLHIYRGLERGLDNGTIMGHEFVGEVVDLGTEVSRIRVGDWVVSPFTSNCGNCFYCRIGLTCRCVEGQLYGWVEQGNGLEGAQAEYVRVPMADSTLLPFQKHLNPEQVLFSGDILSTGFYCADRGEIKEHDLCLVFGCGPVGLMAIIAVKELVPSAHIVAIDSVPERLALARSFGATALHYQKVDVKHEVLNFSEGRGADVVLEAVGSAQAARMAFDMARPGATISTVGVHTSDRLSFSPVEAYDKNISFRIGRAPARHYMDRMLKLIESEKYDLGKIISHRLTLDQGGHAYQIFDQKQDNCLKVIFKP